MSVSVEGGLMSVSVEGGLMSMLVCKGVYVMCGRGSKLMLV